jgi:hypothetical protein
VLLGLTVALLIAGQTGSGPGIRRVSGCRPRADDRPPSAGNRIGLLLLGCSAVFALYGGRRRLLGLGLPRPRRQTAARPGGGGDRGPVDRGLPGPPAGHPAVPGRQAAATVAIVGGAYLADCALITGIFVAGAAWLVSRAPIVVNGHGQLAHNPGPNAVPLIAFIILFGAVPAFWVLFVARQVLSWRRAQRGAPGPAQVAHGRQRRRRHRAGLGGPARDYAGSGVSASDSRASSSKIRSAL